MRISRHKLVGDPVVADYAPAKNIDEVMAPEIVVLHDTASRLEKGSVAQFLRTSPKVSVHFVIEVDGTIAQLAPTNRACDHAGQSHYHGRDGVNAFSIGIELVNPGKMTAGRAGMARAWFGQEFDIEEHGIQRMATPEHGDGFWMPHSEAQVESLTRLLLVLFRDVKSLKDIRTHWYISPGRKIDTNPLLPIETLRGVILGRTDPAEVETDDGERTEIGAGENVMVETNGSNLNMRRWPSFNPNVIGSIPNGTTVLVLAVGKFGGRRWEKVLFDGREGWVVGDYTIAPEYAE